MIEMPNVVQLFAPSQLPAAARHEPALKRLEGIRDVLSTLDLLKMQDHQEMVRTLWILDIANKCIRVVLTDLRDGPRTETLVRQSDDLIASIEIARDKISDIANAAASRDC